MHSRESEFHLQFAEFLEGKLSSAETARLKAALGESAELREDFEEFRRVWSALDEAGRVPSLGGPKFTMKVIDAAFGSSAHRHSPRISPRTMIRIAAAVLVLVTGAFLFVSYLQTARDPVRTAGNPLRTEGNAPSNAGANDEIDAELLADLDIFVSDVDFDALLEMDSDTDIGYRLYEHLGGAIENEAEAAGNNASEGDRGPGAEGGSGG
ncbi:MAG: hypothetical protein NUW37_13945 [Planctomycetes bacterium]|nr:hypothetical protein [Planctomycetota bacterium]